MLINLMCCLLTLCGLVLGAAASDLWLFGHNNCHACLDIHISVRASPSPAAHLTRDNLKPNNITTSQRNLSPSECSVLHIISRIKTLLYKLDLILN